jgi:hypothetical protein
VYFYDAMPFARHWRRQVLFGAVLFSLFNYFNLHDGYDYYDIMISFRFNTIYCPSTICSVGENCDLSSST